MTEFKSIYAFTLAAYEESRGLFQVSSVERIEFKKRGALITFHLIIHDEVEEEWVFNAQREEIDLYFEELERLYS